MTCRFTHRSRLVALAMLATLGGCGSRKGADTAITAAAADSGIMVTAAQLGQITTVKIARQTFNPTILTTGTITFNGEKSTQVIAAISGPVSRLLVDVGDSVQAGQPLATVASPDFAADVAAYRKAEAALHNAQRIATLDEKLYANDALARAQLDQANSDLAAAEADRDAGVQQLIGIGVDSASIDAIRQGKTVPGAQSAIRAPIPGIVVERLITPGQLLQAGTTPTFTIADLSSVWVMGSVFGDDVAAVRKGAPVKIATASSTDSLDGVVDYIGALVDPDSKATAVRILVPNRGRALRQNMLVGIAFRAAHTREGLLVPVSAVLRDDENLPFVFVTTANPNRFLRRRLTLAGRAGDFYEVTAGLAAGEFVVTQGALYLDEAGS